MPRKRAAKKTKLTKTQMVNLMRGSGFFGDLWSGIKSAVKKPSTWLAGASMLPTPLAPVLKGASVLSGLSGNGRRRRRRVGGARKRAIRI